MKCWTVDRRLTAYLENAVPESERLQLLSHFMNCPECAHKLESQRQIRTSLRSLPRLAPPPDLAFRLRVLASKERSTGWYPVPRMRKLLLWVHLNLDNLMKPIALPAAGGLFAALLLFIALVPTLTTNRHIAHDVPLYDQPTSTDPVLKSLAPIGFHHGDAEVDLRIDEQGRIVNYSIIMGSDSDDDQLRRSIENNLLFTTFRPATSFGVPTTSRVRLSFRSSSIDVKG